MLFLFDIRIFGIPTIRQNNFFDFSSYQGHKTSLKEKIIFNFALFVPFMMTHLILARGTTKDMIQSIWSKYVFFDRAIFLTIASLTLGFIVLLFQPDKEVIFSLKFIPMIDTVLSILRGLSIVLFFVSLLDMGKSDLFGFGFIQHFQELGGSEYPPEIEVGVTSRLRRSCRSPLYTSLIMMLLFHNTEITYTSIQFTLSFLLFIFAGTLCEERKLKDDKQFQEYLKNVPNRYIPDFGVLLASDDKQKKRE
jgi:hypothetical protein